jgi:aryl-alcohol dehydrogenase-like predicted oxidoreductase
MKGQRITRREFVRDSALTAAGVAVGMGMAEPANAGQAKKSKILNYNKDMEYRRLGKTGLMISAVTLGGHWKRLIEGSGWDRSESGMMAELDKNRYEVVSRCIEVGINYVDACSGGEILTYAKALRGRREKMYFGFSWYEREPRFPEWRTADALMKGFDQGLKEAGLEYVDLWRISAMMGGENTDAEVEEMVAAFDKAHRQGKARFLGVSSHDREWLKRVIEKWPQFAVVLTPYTAASKVKPTDSLFDAVKKQDVGVLGIKPFSSGSLFKDGAGAGGVHTDRDDELARLALRYILSNDAITAPMPGLISIHQVDNAARAMRERRELDMKETSRLDAAAKEMAANLPPEYRWLRDWEWV